MLTLSTNHTELFQAAHRVFTQFNSGLSLTTGDIELLKANAPSGQKRLKIDVLAWAVIERELS